MDCSSEGGEFVFLVCNSVLCFRSSSNKKPSFGSEKNPNMILSKKKNITYESDITSLKNNPFETYLAKICKSRALLKKKLIKLYAKYSTVTLKSHYKTYDEVNTFVLICDR